MKFSLGTNGDIVTLRPPWVAAGNVYCPATQPVVAILRRIDSQNLQLVLARLYNIIFSIFPLFPTYDSIEMLQRDLDEWMQDYNENRPHRGKYCYGKTPMQTFHDSLPLAKEKMLQYTFKDQGTL